LFGRATAKPSRVGNGRREGHRPARRERGKPGGCDAAGVAEATSTLRRVTSIYINEFQATVENDRLKKFRVDAKVFFVMERQ
jgi:flavin-binding protein dodecin